MGRSQDSFNKKEREKKRQKKKKEKRERKEQKKLEPSKEVEFMYMDAEGNLSATPPDPDAVKEEINIEDIEVSIPKSDKSDTPNFQRKGVVKFFNTEKGYGFIMDSDSKQSVFVHMEGCRDKIKDNDKVTFELGKGPKGPIATDVKLAKAPAPAPPKPPAAPTPPTDPPATPPTTPPASPAV